MTFKQLTGNFHREESGQDLVEYALVLVAIAAGVLTGSNTVSSNFGSWLTTLGATINSKIT